MTDHTRSALHRLRMNSHSRSLAASREDRTANAGEVAGTVWATGQADLASQLRQRRYRPDTLSADPMAMSPAIAAHAIATFTRPGDLVLDPDCGAGTTLVEALHAGCHTIGLAGTHRTWHLARANISAAKAAGAPMDGMVLVLGRRPNTLATAHAAGFTGRIDLILTTLRLPAGKRGPRTLDGALARLQVLLADSRTLLHPGGHVVVTTAPYRDAAQPTELVDVPGQIVAAASVVGLVPLARCVALTGALRRDEVLPWERHRGPQVGHRRGTSMSHPAAVTAHHTALVFRVALPTTGLLQATPSTAAIDGQNGLRQHCPHSNPRQHRIGHPLGEGALDESEPSRRRFGSPAASSAPGEERTCDDGVTSAHRSGPAFPVRSAA